MTNTVATPLSCYARINQDVEALDLARRSLQGLLNPRLGMHSTTSATYVQGVLASRATAAYLRQFAISGQHDSAATAARACSNDKDPQMGIAYAIESSRRALGLEPTVGWRKTFIQQHRLSRAGRSGQLQTT